MTTYGFRTATPEYAKLREELRQAEIELKERVAAVAALRRRLPLETAPEDYVLREADAPLHGPDEPVRDVRLSQLFDAPDQTLVLMHFMYGKAQQEPCPMCTLWADGYDGQVPHLRQRVSFGVLVAGGVGPFREYARSRGWRNLRVLSAGDSTLKRDLGFEDQEGRQEPGVSVFRRDPDGRVLHFWSGGASLGDGHWCGMDLLCPLWHFLDLTPEGRGDFMPRRSYGD